MSTPLRDGCMKPGDRLGHFEVTEPLSKGGMGEVYLALDLHDRSTVALKVLPPRFLDNDFIVNRFLVEIEIYRQLLHPNIVRYIASGVENDQHYIALEHIEGTSLDRILQEEGALDPERGLAIFRDVLFALNFAHNREIFHRDIKPQNIMITTEKVVKLIDFGVAHAKSQFVATGAGMVVGSLCYNSPEQNQGKAVDSRSDVYSLGLVMYEVLAGRRVLPNTSLADIILTQVELDGQLVPPSKHNAKVPPELDAIVMRMLRFEENERFRNAEEVLIALKEAFPDVCGRTETADRSFELADKDLADTHYWKGMNFLAEGRYLEALTEFEHLLNLKHFEHADYVRQVADQVNFLSWTLELYCEGFNREQVPSDARSIEAVELEVLDRLSGVCEAGDGKTGYRKVMADLFAYYKDEVKRIHKGQGKKSSRPTISESTYPEILSKLLAIYGKLGQDLQRNIVQGKLLRFIDRLGNPDKAREFFDELLEARPDDAKLRKGYVSFLLRKMGDVRGAVEQQLALAAWFRDHDEPSKALAQYKAILVEEPDNELARAGKDEILRHLSEVSKETEELKSLLHRLEKINDVHSATNLCLKFLNDHPTNVFVRDRLVHLYRVQNLNDATLPHLVALGTHYHEHGDMAQARDYFVAALLVDPDCETAIHSLVEITRTEDPSFGQAQTSKDVVVEVLVRVGLGDEACGLLRRRLRGGFRDFAILKRIIEINERAGQPHQAAQVLAEMATLACELDEWGEARDAVRKVVETYPEHGSVLLALRELVPAGKDAELDRLLRR